MEGRIEFVKISVGRYSFIAKESPSDWWGRQYKTPYLEESPWWASFFEGVRKGHRGVNLVSFVYESALTSARLNGLSEQEQNCWEAVALYAQTKIVWE